MLSFMMRTGKKSLRGIIPMVADKITDKPTDKSVWPNNTVVGVLCGGWSSEREVSLRSGKNCLSALHRLGYANAVMVDAQLAKTNKPQFLQLLQTLDVAFLALHGAGGEDGSIQGLLSVLDIPFTGNDLTGCALTMDKVITKQILAANHLPVLPTLTIDTRLPQATWPVPERWPVMVKPLGEGSSIGMSKVNTANALPAAITAAAHYGHRVMIEPYVEGLSVTVGVFDREGQPTVTPILGFKTQTEWYDLTAKYTPGLTEFLLPAPLSALQTEQIQQQTLQAHQACHCHGVSRVDWIVEPDGKAYILEVNTIPGMTDLSDLPAQAGAMGVSYDQLVEYLLQTAKKPAHAVAEQSPVDTVCAVSAG
jgi:D-alanine-D-alanine ligase